MYGVEPGDTSWSDCLFDVWSLLMDTGTQYYAVHDNPRFIGAVCTICGLVFAAVLTGFVVDAVMEKMNDLRKGKSAVMEWDHTVLIGWTDRSIAFIAQICLANESGGGGCIVVSLTPYCFTAQFYCITRLMQSGIGGAREGGDGSGAGFVHDLSGLDGE